MDTTNLITRIVSELRKQAETYAEDGALVEGEAVLRNRAEAIERIHADWLGEELNLKEATREIRYSYSRLHRHDFRTPERGWRGHLHLQGVPRRRWERCAEVPGTH